MMRRLKGLRKKIVRLAVILLVIVIGIGIYLQWSYHRIYQFIGQQALVNPTSETSFMLGRTDSRSDLKYVALGDSLTAGVGSGSIQGTYPYHIAKYLEQKGQVECINFGIPGARTSDVIKNQLDKAVRTQPDYVSLLIGVNDIHGLVFPRDFESNFRQIVGTLKNKTSAKIILINIPYVGTDQLILPPYNWLFEARTKQFNAIVDKVAVEYGIPIIDLYSATISLARTNSSYYSVDQFHPSGVGYRVWGEGIARTLDGY